MSQLADLTDSSIVMAEQQNHDVVNQTLSGGEPSPSDVPASTNDKISAGGDVGETKHTTVTTQTTTKANDLQTEQNSSAADSSLGKNEMGRDFENSGADKDFPKQGPGPVATRALEMNGVASVSDGGEDTASLGGSESDASRTDGKRSSSKKPTTFKPVSFAKFSVPKAPGALNPTKTSAQAPSSLATPLSGTLQSSRPRLVAKTTSLRDSLSKSGTGAGKTGGGGPDPNQVWNKNRPVQPTPPKHLTDEELKQQYGIHMTSRIQEDGGGTEAKWADIDDDEDDWAPETIEWTDGTKTSLAHTEAAHPTGQDPKALTETKINPAAPEPVPTVKEAPKVVPKPTTIIGPNPTVLRLGANAERQAKSATVLSKGPNDKPSSASTSPAPPPAKSPWAPLPPVERVSPVMPPVQLHSPGRPHFREPHVSEAPSGIVPPKEIAADDFNRTWRETQTGTTRELFNSRSGRYEPVPEVRKAPWRHEQSFRPSTLLQRPAQGEQAGPAEPSAAFQTHRTTGHDSGHWNRRRTSSNVSGGSGSFGRRMSIGRPDAPQRVFDTRRGSQVHGNIDPSLLGKEQVPSKEASVRGLSPGRHGPSSAWPSHAPAGPQHEISVNVSHTASQQPPASPTPEVLDTAVQAPQEDPVAMQERIMKEKRLEARQRRLEQEEKEEAAKRERIRQKLEALGPAPEKSKLKRKESLDTSKPEVKASLAAAQASQSPPKPPVPEPTGEPKQYGMMKVHHPDTVKKLVAANEKERTVEKPAPIVNVRRAHSPGREPKHDAAIVSGPIQPPDSQQPRVSDKLSESRTEEPSSQWKSNLDASNSYSPWSANPKLGSAASSIANPWKPLSNDKTLGNGIFDQALGGFPPRDISLRGHLGLDQPPMAPGPQSFTAPRSTQEPTTIASLPSPDVRHVPYDPLHPIARPGPIGPPSTQQPHWQQEPRVTGTAAWNNFHTVAAKREAEENEKLLGDMNTMREGQSLQVAFNETWRQVRPGDQNGQRQVIGVQRPTDNTGTISNHLPGFDHTVSTLPFPDTNARPLVNVPARSSRFFPQATEQFKRPAYEEEDQIRSPSPPPPEELSNHPVYTGNSNRPLVHLPAPKPIVKLPPKIVAPPPPPPTFASMVAAPPRAPPQPISTATSWQEKINCLFGKKTVSEKKNALAVTSASKEPLDVQLHIAAVSVSLPNHVEIENVILTGDGVASAQQVEEADEIFEDREAGSLPVVRVPNNAPPAAWHAAPPPSQSRLRVKNLKPMQVHSIEPYLFGISDKDSPNSLRVSIRFPGTIAAKTMTLPKKNGSQSSRQRGPSSFKLRKGTKPREGSGSSNPKKTSSSQHNGSSSSSSPRHQSRNAAWGPRTFSGSQ